MWKKDEAKPQGAPENFAAPASAVPVSNAAPTPVSASAPPVSPRAAATIGNGIRIKGEVIGNEDLFVDGYVEGKLSLTTNSSLTIGPNGSVKADLNAREIIVRGKVEGKVTARDKLLIGSTGQITGEVQTDRLAIEDGALLRGKVEAGKQQTKIPEVKAAAAAATSKPSDSLSLNSGTTAN